MARPVDCKGSPTIKVWLYGSLDKRAKRYAIREKVEIKKAKFRVK